MSLFPIQDAFIRGEISPRLHARASLDLYRGALARCENFLTLPHGGIRKRGGTYFVNETKNSTGKVRLIDFKYSEAQSYCLELGHLYCRVHANGGYTGVEFVTPWGSDMLEILQYVQSADVMWVVHPLVPPCTITRRSATDWGVDGFFIPDGPFGETNTDENSRMWVTASTGTVTAVASTPVFTQSDVGRLLRIEMESYRNIAPWEAFGRIGDAQFCRYDGNVYRIIAPSGQTGVRFGGTPPTHTKGIEQDGPKAEDPSYDDIVGVDLEYIHSGFGVGRITALNGSQQATVDVISRFPDQVVGESNGRYLYSLGAFRPGNYPVAVMLFEERLIFASKLSIYGSRTGDFRSFRTGEKDDDGLQFLLAANEANDITWLADADGFLAIGTIGGVRALSGSGIDEALTPSSFKNRSSSTPRCSTQRPLNTGQAFLYVIGGARAIAEVVTTGAGKLEGSEASQVSEHIAKIGGGITSNGYQEMPDSVAWFSLANGQAMAFTYQRDQEVRGFHRHIMAEGGFIECLTVTPNNDGSDDVWLCVRRTIAGQQRRFIELLVTPPEYHEAATDFCLDCGLSYSGPLVTAVGGLAHLEGAKVDMLADNFKFSGLTVSGGIVQIPSGLQAGNVQVGLPYEAVAETLELDVGGRDGSVIGRRKRIPKVLMSVLDTDTVSLQVQSLQRKRWENVKIPTIEVSNGLLPRTTGNIEVPIDDSWEGQARIKIRHNGPTACTIRSITPDFDSEP